MCLIYDFAVLLQVRFGWSAWLWVRLDGGVGALGVGGFG